MEKFALGCIVEFSIGYCLGARVSHENYKYLRSAMARNPFRQLPAAMRQSREKINPAASVVIPPSAN